MSKPYRPETPAESASTGGNVNRLSQPWALRKDLQQEYPSSNIEVYSTIYPSFAASDMKNFSDDGKLFSIFDQVKNSIQAFTSMPIMWWPFSDPQRPLEQGKKRMAWKCSLCSARLSVDLKTNTTEALGQKLQHKQVAARKSLFEGIPLESEELLLPGRDEAFDDEERDENMSQCSTLVGFDSLDEAPGVWQRQLDGYCAAQHLVSPQYRIVSDRRGGRTAWSCVLSVGGSTFAARYWYDYQFAHNAREDAAELALKSLNRDMLKIPPLGRGQFVTMPSFEQTDNDSLTRSLSGDSSTNPTSGSMNDSSSQSRKAQRTQRVYPPSSIDHISNSGTTVADSPGKWIHWCVDATRTRLHDICVEAQTGAKRGREFIDELVKSYRRLRGIRWWLSLTDCAAVKVVKFIRLLDEEDFVTCGLEKVSLDEIRRTQEYDISIGINLDDEDLHLAWVETTLAHYLLHHAKYITDDKVDEIISGLPKKTNLCMNKKARSVGYGIRGVHGLSVMKFLYLSVVTSGIGLVFFIYWLVEHPGDLQNASVPYFMLVAAVGGFIAISDFYTR